MAGLQGIQIVKYKVCSQGTYIGSLGKIRYNTIGGIVGIVLIIVLNRTLVIAVAATNIY